MALSLENEEQGSVDRQTNVEPHCTDAQERPTESETGWLIERCGPEWWSYATGEWRRDSLSATHFSRREDADAAAGYSGLIDGFPTEHMWVQRAQDRQAGGEP